MRPDRNTESFEEMSGGHDGSPLKSMGRLPEPLESNAIHWPETYIQDFNSPISTEVHMSQALVAGNRQAAVPGRKPCYCQPGRSIPRKGSRPPGKMDSGSGRSLGLIKILPHQILGGRWSSQGDQVAREEADQQTDDDGIKVEKLIRPEKAAVGPDPSDIH